MTKETSQKMSPTLDKLIKLLIFWFPIGFLSIRHGVHITLYGLTLLFLYELLKKSIKINFNKQTIILLLSLGSLFFATLIQQTIFGEFNIKAFDGPSRLLISGLVLVYLSQKNINYIEILEISLPISLIFLLLYLKLNPEFYWGDRWANNFVDPNSLGSQTTILSILCLLTTGVSNKTLINSLKLLGALCGLYIAIKTQSRGGWASTPFMIICWLLIKYKITNFHDNNKQSNFLFIKVLVIFGAAALTITLNDTVQNRLTHTIYEITTWFRDPLIYTSAGARMSMWVSSIELIKENIWGYGEIAIKDFASAHPLRFGLHQNGMKDLIVAGPHSDFMSKGLSLGLIGIFSYLSLIFTPLFIFISNLGSINKRQSVEVGLLYLTGVFIVGIFNESLSLKYLCTFYGLMIACLAADVLRDNYTKRTPKQKAA